MIGNRIPCVLITLLLVMIIAVSTAPVHEDEKLGTDYDEAVTSEAIHETTVVPDVVTKDLLFFDVTAIPLDENIKTNDLLYYRKGAVPITPKPDEPRSFTPSTSRDTVNISYNEI